MSWKCPDCDNEIENLCYEVSTSGYEYGTADLSDTKKIATCDIVTDTNYDDSGDTEWSGDVEYKCPECDNYIDPEDLIWEDEDDDEDEEEGEKLPPEPEETKFKIIPPLYDIIDDDNPKDSSNSTIICKECNYIFCCNGGKEDWNSGGESEFSECPKCGTSNTVKEYKELMLKDFFVLMNKPNDNKKIKSRSIKSLGKSNRKIRSKTSGHKRRSKKNIR